MIVIIFSYLIFMLKLYLFICKFINKKLFCEIHEMKMKMK